MRALARAGPPGEAAGRRCWRRGALSLSSPPPPLGLGGTPRPSGLPASAPHGAGPPKASRWRRGLSSPLTPRHWCCVKMRIPGTARSTSPRGSARRATRPRGVRASGSARKRAAAQEAARGAAPQSARWLLQARGAPPRPRARKPFHQAQRSLFSRTAGTAFNKEAVEAHPRPAAGPGTAWISSLGNAGPPRGGPCAGPGPGLPVSDPVALWTLLPLSRPRVWRRHRPLRPCPRGCHL